MASSRLPLSDSANLLTSHSINFRTDGTYVQVLDVSLGNPGEPERDEDDTTYAGPVRLTTRFAVKLRCDDFLPSTR